MNVNDLHSLVVAAAKFSEAAEISASAKTKLQGVCDALGPFQNMEIGAFAELMSQAKQYRDTGILPVAAGKPAKGGGTKKPKANSEDAAKRVEQFVGQLKSLYEKVHEESVGFGAIDEICDEVGKLSAADVKAVATGFDLRLSSKATKPQTLSEIKRKLTDQKGSAQRIAAIDAR
jgi:hypothetical protein